MMKVIEVTGPSYEEARVRAAGALGALPEDLEFTVVTEGHPGIFGLFAREWRLRAEVRPHTADRAADLVRTFFARLGMDVQPTIRRDGETVYVECEGDFGFFLRRRGEALDALQQVVLAATGRHEGERIVLDAGGYRAQRRRSLETLAREVAEQVRRTGEPAVLETMPAFERRIIHTVIQDYEDLRTESRGEDPHRQIVVSRR